MPAIIILSLLSLAITSAAACRLRSLLFFLVGVMIAMPLAAWSLWASGWSLGATIG